MNIECMILKGVDFHINYLTMILKVCAVLSCSRVEPSYTYTFLF